MRAVVQRVLSASVEADADGSSVARIERGVVVLLGVGRDDDPEDGERLAAKIGSLRIFEDERGKMARSVADTGGSILAIPQFTLYGDIRGGRRPDFTAAAIPEKAQRLFDGFCGALRGKGLSVSAGRFGAHMRIAMVADGPVTMIATTDGLAEAEIAQRSSATGGPLSGEPAPGSPRG